MQIPIPRHCQAYWDSIIAAVRHTEMQVFKRCTDITEYGDLLFQRRYDDRNFITCLLYKDTYIDCLVNPFFSVFLLF